MNRFILALACCLFCTMPAWAMKKPRNSIELLQTTITPKTVGYLDGIACRNLEDNIIHLNITIDWHENTEAHEDIVVETDGYQRLVFWNERYEFLFPLGSYTAKDGKYIINNYFIPQNGGTHQGTSSIYFELYKPSPKEKQFPETAKQNPDCE